MKINQHHHHINKLKKKKHTFITIHIRKKIDKNKNPFMILKKNPLRNLGIKICFNLIRRIYKNPIRYIILIGQRVNAFP